jgi:hypothetical protein
MQQHFCDRANFFVRIIQRCEKFVVCGQIPFLVPLQVANKQIQGVAMADAI